MIIKAYTKSSVTELTFLGYIILEDIIIYNLLGPKLSGVEPISSWPERIF